jgi:hypothetical protein
MRAAIDQQATNQESLNGRVTASAVDGIASIVPEDESVVRRVSVTADGLVIPKVAASTYDFSKLQSTSHEHLGGMGDEVGFSKKSRVPEAFRGRSVVRRAVWAAGEFKSGTIVHNANSAAGDIASEVVAPSSGLSSLGIPYSDPPSPLVSESDLGRPAGQGPNHYTLLYRFLAPLCKQSSRVLCIEMRPTQFSAFDIALAVSTNDGSSDRAWREVLAPAIHTLNNETLGLRAFVWSAVEVRLYESAHESARKSVHGQPSYPSRWFEHAHREPQLSDDAMRRLTMITFESLFHERAEACYEVRSDSRAAASISVPYPTAFHASNSAQMNAHLAWVNASKRTMLAAYKANPHGRGMQLRQKLQGLCNSSEQVLCSQEDAPLDTNAQVYGALRRAKFCLEPTGDTPTRSQMFECLLCGAIPVFFSSCLSEKLVFENMYSPYLPIYRRTHFGAGLWAVVLPYDRVMAEPSYVLNALAAIPAEKVASMQAQIRSSMMNLVFPRTVDQDQGMNADATNYGALSILEKQLATRGI